MGNKRLYFTSRTTCFPAIRGWDLASMTCVKDEDGVISLDALVGCQSLESLDNLRSSGMLSYQNADLVCWDLEVVLEVLFEALCIGFSATKRLNTLRSILVDTNEQSVQTGLRSVQEDVGMCK